jgi:hypothetical protein
MHSAWIMHQKSYITASEQNFSIFSRRLDVFSNWNIISTDALLAPKWVRQQEYAIQAEILQPKNAYPNRYIASTSAWILHQQLKDIENIFKMETPLKLTYFCSFSRELHWSWNIATTSAWLFHLKKEHWNICSMHVPPELKYCNICSMDIPPQRKYYICCMDIPPKLKYCNICNGNI